MADKKISALASASTPLAGTEVLPIVQNGSTVNVSIANLTNGRSVLASSYSSTGGFTLNTGYISADNKIYTDNTNATGAALWFRKGRDVGTGAVDAVGLDCLNGTESDIVPAIIRAKPFYINDTVGQNKFENGNLVIGTSGKGIDFSATGEAGGMTSELLNDYEEGTFTPTGTNFTVVGTATWTGSYTKIGRLVFWQAKVVASTTITAAGGTADITMPFYVRGGSYSALGTASNASGFTGYGNGMYVDASLQFYSPAFPPQPVVVFSGVYQTD